MSDVVLDRRALCDIEDIKHLVPGYEFDPELEDTLISLINEVSDDIHTRTGRELVSLDEAAAARLFDLTATHERRRTVRIGDCTTITTVKILELDSTVLETVPTGSYIPLPRVRGSADPIRQLWFPPSGVTSPSVELACGRTLEVTATWGFPALPSRLPGAVAKLVIVRYVSDVTDGQGTDFANALGDINIAGLYRSATETIDRLSNPPLA